MPESVNFTPYPLASPSLLSMAHVPGFMEAARRARELLSAAFGSAASISGLTSMRARAAVAFLPMTFPSSTVLLLQETVCCATSWWDGTARRGDLKGDAQRAGLDQIKILPVIPAVRVQQ